MADHTITVSNTLSLSGPAVTSKWDVAEWDTDVWDSTNDLSFYIDHYLSAGTITLTDAVGSTSAKGITDSITCTSSINLMGLYDAAGYLHVLQGVTDPDNRLFPTYTEQTAASDTYTEQSAASTTWSAA